MKIIVDKIDAPPPHALSVQEVKALLRCLPSGWEQGLWSIHLKATLPNRSRFERPVILGHMGRLNVCSRGLAPTEARREILRELAIRGLGKSTRMWHRLSAAETEEIDRAVAPVLARVEAADAVPDAPRTEAWQCGASEALQAAGYSWSEARSVISSIETEQRQPTSRKKANRLVRAEEALRQASFDLETLVLRQD